MRTQVLEDIDFGAKVLPADGTSGGRLGPHSNGSPLAVHDARGKTGRSAASIGRRPAPFLAALRAALMDVPQVAV